MKKIIYLLLLVFLFTNQLSAQQKTLTGKVADEKGEPISFVTIKVKGARSATKSDENGLFKIVAAENAILQISSTGYGNKEAGVSGKENFINVTLTRTSIELTTVAITTSLGIKRQSKELGYAATTINNKTLTQGKSVNVAQALNGKISGVSVATMNNSVFEMASINIRGIRSLTGNNQPMLVIDGAPTPLNILSSIAPDDIQDLTVLKSAASAAIYGPDAVNGVIVVTTKRGSRKKLNITVSSTVQFAKVAFFPKLQKKFGAGAGEILDPYGNYDYVPYENQQFGPAFDGSIKEIGIHLEDGSIQTGPYSAGHYNDKVKFWNTGISLQNSISLAGEDFFMSIDDAKIKGLMPDDENRRTSVRFNAGKKYGKFAVNYGLNYVLQNFDVVNEAGFSRLFPSAYNGSIFFLILQTPSNVPLLSYKDWQNNKFAQYSNYYNEFAVNPYWVIGNIRQRGRQDDLTGNIDASFEIAPWLKATAKLSTNLSFSNFKNTQAPVQITDWADSRNATQYTNRPGSVFDSESFTSRINFDYFLSGEHSIGRDFSVKYIGGGMIRQNRSKNVSIGGNNLVVPYLYNVSVRSGDASVPLFPGNAEIESRILSGYGSVGIGYKDWAFVEFTGRNDWDSRLLKQNRSFFYPGANAAIMLSDAFPAIKDNNYISYAKIRGAYSKSGNVNVGVYSLQSTYSQPAGFPFGGTAGFTANQIIPSPDLKPEFVSTKEVGIEMGLLKNRINFEATYFNQTCNNQILQVSQSSTTGYTIGLENAASFKNYGMELDLGLTPLIKIGKGKIDLKLNATYNNNEVLSTLGNIPVVIGGTNQFIQAANGSPTVNNIAIVGKPAFAFQLTDYIRDPEGHVIVDRITGMPSQAAELVVKGRSIPLWVVGVSPTYSIGGLSVSMTWDYKGGHNFYAGIGSDEDFAGISARSAEYGRQRFVFPNSVYFEGGKYVKNTDVQVQDGNAGFWTSSSANTAIGTNYFASADALRLREINISYTIPQKWIGNEKIIKKVTVSAVGKNLLLFVPTSNQWGDPEFNSATGANTFGLSSSFQSPSSRLFGGSVTVQF